MPQSDSSLAKPLPLGRRQPKPAGFSFLTKRCSPEDRLKIIRYLSGCRNALLTDLGGEENLSAQKIILIDRLVSLLGVIRGIEEFHSENILTPTGDLKPALGKNYLSFINSTRLLLTTLGIERHSEPLLTATDLIAAADREQEREEERTTRDAETQERA